MLKKSKGNGNATDRTDIVRTRTRSYRSSWMATLIVIMLAIAACGGSGTDDGAGATSAPDADSGEAPAGGEGGTLVVGRTGDIDVLDPHLATAFQSVRTLELVYDTLFMLNPELLVEPGLAESWEFSDDGAQLTITLREGVVFHDGSTLDSSDVAASLERILDEGTGAVARSNVLSIASIDTPDASTVVLDLSQPDGTIVTSLADPNTAIVSTEAIEAGTIDREPVGSGPFAWSEWDQGTSVTLVANDDFWGDGPFIEELVFRVIPDESSVLSGLRAGQIQLGELTDPVIVLQANEPNIVQHKTPALSYHALMLNSRRPPLDNLQVRQAIACSIDRQQVVDTAALGEGKVTGPITIPAYESDADGLPCEGQRDVDEAKRLLGEAGVGDVTINAIVLTGGYALATPVAESLKAQLAEAGINLELQLLERGTYVDRWLAADFDAAVALNGGRPDPHQMYVRYWTSDGNLNDVAAFSNAALDDAMAQGQAETDPAARADAYDAFSEELQQQSPWIWLFSGFEYVLHTDAVTGFEPIPNGSLRSLAQTRLG